MPPTFFTIWPFSSRSTSGRNWGRWSPPLLLLMLVGLGITATARGAGKGELELRAVDKETGAPIAIRMHLKDPKGKPVKPPKVPMLGDHFILEGTLVLKLGEGTYTFEAERGPEYKIRSGSFIIERMATDNHPIVMERFIDMAKEGWWSGDLHLRREEANIKPLLLSEDLHVAPVLSWDIQADSVKKGPAKEEEEKEASSKEKTSSTEPQTFGDKRMYSFASGADDRFGGKLLFLNVARPKIDGKVTSEFPSPTKLMQGAWEENVSHFSASRASAWDLPVWVASGKLDSIEILHSQMLRDPAVAIPMAGIKPAAGTKATPIGKANADIEFPRDMVRFRGEQGLARFQEHVYFQLLNCGLRISPAAGSGSGDVVNPAGYNRVYVYCGEDFTWENWWRGLKQGRVMVTNGPMILPRVKSTPKLAQSDPQGELPGQVFQVEQGTAIDLNVALNLSTREKIEYLDIIKNGELLEQVRLDKWAEAGGKLPPVPFEESGWLMIRAVTNSANTYRAAYAGPYYVEVGYKPRVSKASAEFFLDWVTQRAKKLAVEDKEEREEALAPLRKARDFWKAKVEEANAP